MFALFAWFVYSMANGRGDEIVCGKITSEADAIANYKLPLKAKIVGINGNKEVNFHIGPYAACKVDSVIVSEEAYIAIYKSYKGWVNVMHKGYVGWLPESKIEIVGKYGTP
jgi:SH3-like domain-containing protein